ncbi:MULTISPECIES: SRPBCC domain-containing protein [Sphingobacterium]|uniref:SRPBCC family protein n=1 Tax=Sphingobacterium TaxID=28453 RepID=UPI0013D91ECE|nr:MULTISPECIES: SRPBCC domain-containing protein [unclassified Sphingobacterium]
MSNTLFDIDRNKHTITVISKYQASLELLWAAWTQSAMLDNWWAPQPWKVETKEMNFVQDGRWLYAMVSPEGEKIWSLIEYIEISPLQYFIGIDAFCDENGAKNYSQHPGSKWHTSFEQGNRETTVTNLISFDSTKAMDDMLDMGFQEGFQSGLDNLEKYLSNQTNK